MKKTNIRKKKFITGFLALFFAVSSVLFFSVPVYVKADNPPQSSSGGGHWHGGNSTQPGELNAGSDGGDDAPSLFGGNAAPFDILNDMGSRSIGNLQANGMSHNASEYIRSQAGLPSIAYILTFAAVISGVALMIITLTMLIIVNYPKTVAQTKQKVAQIMVILIVIAMLPLFFDLFYTITRMLMGYSS